MNIQEKLIRVPLDSGEVALVRPLSPYARAALRAQAKTLHPDPDRKLYEKPLENAYDPSLVESAELNPEFKKAQLDATIKQMNAFYEFIIDAGVVEDTETGRSATLARYADKIAALRQHGDLLADGWLAIVKYCLISTRQDVVRIADASNDALTPEEIAAGASPFQRSVQRHAGDDHHGEEAAPSISG